MDFIFDPSLVLYLPFYELDGASFMSRDAYGHLCTRTGALWRLNGHYFDGTDDYIDCGDDTVFDLGNNTTLLLWLKPADLSGTYAPFGWGTVGSNVYYLQQYTDGSLKLRIYRNGALRSTLSNTGIVSAGQFVFVAVVKNGTAGEIYVDAIDQTISSEVLHLPDATGKTFHVGRRGEITGNMYKGTIGELAKYNRALTPAEIQHNYLATKWRYR